MDNNKNTHKSCVFASKSEISALVAMEEEEGNKERHSQFWNGKTLSIPRST